MSPEDARRAILAAVLAPRSAVAPVPNPPRPRRARVGPPALLANAAQTPRSKAKPATEDPMNWANLTTMAGYSAGLWWIAGGPAWAALASVLADEADGVIARERGESTAFGDQFDWGADVILATLTLRRLKAPLWLIVGTTAAQVYTKQNGMNPPVGGIRAILMLAAVFKEAYEKRGKR